MAADKNSVVDMTHCNLLSKLWWLCDITKVTLIYRRFFAHLAATCRWSACRLSHVWSGCTCTCVSLGGQINRLPKSIKFRRVCSNDAAVGQWRQIDARRLSSYTCSKTPLDHIVFSAKCVIITQQKQILFRSGDFSEQWHVLPVANLWRHTDT